MTSTTCRVCGGAIDRPDQCPKPDVHGACYIEEGRTFGAVLQQYPDATVERRTFDAGQSFVVRAKGQTVRVTSYWDESTESVNQRVLARLASQ